MTGIHQGNLRRLITTTLDKLRLNSPEAIALLLGTAAVESSCGRYLYQIGGGPARGIFQMEPVTEKDIWINYLKWDPDLMARVICAVGRRGPGSWLTYDLAYQVAMARLHYLRAPGKLPPADDLQAQAAYWKDHYNTPSGRGQLVDYIKAVNSIT